MGKKGMQDAKKQAMVRVGTVLSCYIVTWFPYQVLSCLQLFAPKYYADYVM